MLASAHDAELKAALDMHAAITAKLGEVAAQRDALLAAVKHVAHGGFRDLQWQRQADAAIAACEGGQDV